MISCSHKYPKEPITLPSPSQKRSDPWGLILFVRHQMAFAFFRVIGGTADAFFPVVRVDKLGEAMASHD